jgi:CBS domain containing-hemolysin-like protein
MSEPKPNPGAVGAFLAWLRARRGGKADENSLRESVEELIEDFEEESTSGDFDEPRLIRNVLKLGELSAEDVMVPRADIVAVEADTTLDNLVKAMSAEAHSRMPVYRANLDDVIGMVHMKDVLTYWDRKEQFSLAQILRKVLFVAPSMRALDLLLEMRQSRTHIALVVDEYGGIDGLITIEDLVEQIVGEIEDEHDIDETPALQPKPDGTLVADARTTLEDFESAVGRVLTEDERAEIDTLGGLVTALAGRVPRRGELVRHPDGLEFEVLESDARRVRRLRVRNLPRGGTPTPDGG